MFPFWYSEYDRYTDIENDIVYNSILNTSRKIESLKILSAKFNPDIGEISSASKNRLKKIIEQIGKDVVEVEIRSFVLSLEDFELLNLMPNMQKFYSVQIKRENFEIPLTFQLRLCKLKYLAIWGSKENILEVFDRLPENVLHKLDLFDNCVSTNVHFQNQKSVVNISTGLMDLFDFKNFKIKNAFFRVYENIQDIDNMRGHDKLTFLRLQLFPRLKSLCLLGSSNFQEIRDGEFFEVMKNHGKNLHTLHCRSSIFTKFTIKPTELWKLKELFKDQFMQFSFKGDPVVTECLLRKMKNEKIAANHWDR